jgi:cellulose synthase/poly-beta-1,6-N-acetylglucosamine synthase-like glycosyltransferase
MCPHTIVAQQALNSPRRLIRQRTRWVQGHYSCWNHLPLLWRARGVKLRTRLDLSLHLLLACIVLVVAGQAVLGAAGFAGLFPIHESVLARLVGNELVFRVLVLAAASGPLALVALAYQRAAVRFRGADARLPLWAIPGMFLAFTAYMYFWGLPSSFRAFARMTVGAEGWAKTARDPVAIPTNDQTEPVFA